MTVKTVELVALGLLFASSTCNKNFYFKTSTDWKICLCLLKLTLVI